MVGIVGLEPTRFAATDFKSASATNYDISPYLYYLISKILCQALCLPISPRGQMIKLRLQTSRVKDCH